MQNLKAQAAPRRSGMMERLRRLRSEPKPETDPSRATGCAGEDHGKTMTSGMSRHQEHASGLHTLDDNLELPTRFGGGDEDRARPAGQLDGAVQPPEEAGPSDYEVFLRQAAEDERQRVEDGHATLPKPKQEPPLNQFYSNDWADAAPGQPRLVGIQESDDDDDDDDDEDGGAEDISPAQQRGAGWSPSSSMSSGSHDFADAPDTRPTLTQTWPGTGREGRHVSFKEPPRARRRSGSNPNVYHARYSESPQGRRAIARRKNIRRTITDCVRRLT